jgi:hypothetical protein
MTILDELGVQVQDEAGSGVFGESGPLVGYNTRLFTSAYKYNIAGAKQMETVYIGHDNVFKKTLYVNYTALTADEMAVISEITLVFDDVAYTSAAHPTAFDWETDAATGTVCFYMGRISGLASGEDRTAKVIITFTDGTSVVWGTLHLLVLDLGV